MKKIMIAITLSLALMLCACQNENGGNNTNTTSTTEAVESKISATLEEIGDKAVEKRECADDPVKYSAEDIKEELGINAELYKEFYYSYAGDFVSVETIAIFEAADGKSAELTEKLKTKKQSLESQSKNYNEKNYAMVTDARIASSGKYVYMVISPNADEIVKIIKQYI